jgi:hypothetical protein
LIEQPRANARLFSYPHVSRFHHLPDRPAQLTLAGPKPSPPPSQHGTISYVRKIPDALREQMAADPFMKRCAITGTTLRIQWHHNLIHAGRQVNEAWAILPLNADVHDRVPADKELKEKLDWIMLNRATDEQLAPYCRAINYIRRRDILNQKYGQYTGG